MKSKKALMGYAALLILIFHLWIPFTSASAETFLYRSAYIGVDLFFLVSGCSLGKRDEMEFGSFAKNRFKAVYVPFLLLCLINGLYKGRSVSKILLNMFSVEFLQKGGGAFLWFVSGIMLLYLLTPAIIAFRRKAGMKSLGILLAGWAVLVGILQYVFDWTAIFILLNRIPIYLIGLYYGRLPKLKDTLRPWVIAAGLAVGAALVYTFGTTSRLNVPVKECYYIIALPLTLMIAEAFEYYTDHCSLRLKPLEWIGTFTLELYGLQMIFGFDLEVKLVKMMGNTPAVFLLTSGVLILASYVYHTLYSLLSRRLLTTGGKTK